MKVGDLVMIKQGSRYGKMALVARKRNSFGVIRVIRDDGTLFGYYKRDLEALCK